MRGRGRPIATVLADALAGRPGARRAAAAAAFAEALGPTLAHQVRLRALARDGRIIAVARSEPWAEEVRRLSVPLLEQVNARLGGSAACAIEVRVGPLEP